MLKRLIIVTLIGIAVLGGLLYVLHIGEEDNFFDLLTKALNGGFAPKRSYSVEVNVYEPRIGTDSNNNLETLSRGEPKLVDTLRLYFVEYYDLLGSLNDNPDSAGRRSFAKLYERNSPSREVDLLILDRKIATRKQSTVSLGFNSCDVGIRLVSANFGNSNFVEVKVSECFSVVFDGIVSEVSGYSGVEHMFTFARYNADSDWLIVSHTSSSAFAQYVNTELEKLVAADGLTRESAGALAVNVYVAQLRSLLDGSDGKVYFYPGSDSGDNIVAHFNYNRNDALDYAARYANPERIRRNADYRNYPQNGTNFVSQCLHAGGIPSNSVWKAGNAAWTGAEKFFEHISSLPEQGIAAAVCFERDGAAGDIIQFVNGGGEAVHSVIITGKVGDEYLISGNSEDFSDFPLLATGFDIIRVIKIYGHN